MVKQKKNTCTLYNFPLPVVLGPHACDPLKKAVVLETTSNVNGLFFFFLRAVLRSLTSIVGSLDDLRIGGRIVSLDVRVDGLLHHGSF